MIPRTDILPAGQRAFWDAWGPAVPDRFALYGGTAVALRYGHRVSVDFDFFTETALDEPGLRATLPCLAGATVLRRQPDTLVVSQPMPAGPVKLSFFAGIDFGRVGVPDRVAGFPPVASPIDLLATKLKVLLERVEVKDYLDVEALLRGGLSLGEGIAAAAALFGRAVNPLDMAKAVAWFRDGGLDAALPQGTKAYLTEASRRFEPTLSPPPILSRRLAG